MDANTFFTLAIAGLVIFAFFYDRVKSLFQPKRPKPAINEETIKQASEEAPLAFSHWIAYVNSQPDTVPHTAIIGPTGSGKTTLALAVLHNRPGQIVILSGKEGDYWGGLKYIGIDDDLSYTTMSTTVDTLLTEVRQRNLAAKQQRLTADWLTIVIDDFSTLVKECEKLADLVKLVARIGRSLRIRLVMLSDSALVKAIGLEGEGETRSNFAFIRSKRGHTASLDIDDQRVPIDTQTAPQFSMRDFVPSRAWRAASDPTSELARLHGLSEPDWAFIREPQTDRPDETRQTEVSERILMRKYRVAGVSRDAARKLLAADGFALDNNLWAELGKELD